MGITLKIKSYLIFTKFRLSVLVILSAISGYLFAGGNNFKELLFLIFGGILVTAASNGANQIWERKIDALMDRTKSRPLPAKQMAVLEGVIVVIICLIIGGFLLFELNFNSFMLGICAFVTYVFIYTPLKRKTPWAVIIGAFPGAIPPMLGAIAYTNEFGAMPGALFFVQFVWQLPHFWAIAWVLDDDYAKGGFNLLPSSSRKSKLTAFRIQFASLLLIPFSLFPWLLALDGITKFSVIGASLLGLVFYLYAYKLYLSLNDKDAKKLMFASFIYLPMIQFVYVADKILTL